MKLRWASLTVPGIGLRDDDIDLLVKVSVIYDQFAIENMGHIKYVTHLGSKWKVTSIEPEYPRLIMTLGGLFNEQSE